MAEQAQFTQQNPESQNPAFDPSQFQQYQQQQPDLQHQQLLQQQQLQQQYQQQQQPPPPPPPVPYNQFAQPPPFGQYPPAYYANQAPPYPYPPPAGFGGSFPPQYAPYPSPAGFGVPQSQPQTRPLGKSNKIIWIGNLHQDVTEQELIQAFSVYGQIETVKLVRTKACGFVTFQDPTCAMNAHDKMGQSKFHGQEIKIGWGKADQAGYQANQPQTDYSQHDGSLQQNLPDINRDLPQQPVSRTLWIGNVTPIINESILRQAFTPFGTIEYVRLWVTRHCAFITFATDQEATLAKTRMDRQRIGDTIIRVNYGKA